ncbi:MAG: STAS domain-containing protein [Phycisphaeraceae bacterium]|nr:STAS domain-containing protein [Phycisphaerales bacterium]MCB9859955.1 STAS domain-containing protein [Phycisphaeraceae bacterium]
MFGKLFRKHENDNDAHQAHSGNAAPPKPEFDAGALKEMYSSSVSTPDTSTGEERSLATYDRLGETLVATLTARTLSGPEASACVAELLENLRGPSGTCTHVVLDLQNVEYMDSACIGVLVELLTRLQQVGGQIALVNADPNVEYLFKLTRLDRLFPICRDVMKAIEVVERAA